MNSLKILALIFIAFVSLNVKSCNKKNSTNNSINLSPITQKELDYKAYIDKIVTRISFYSVDLNSSEYQIVVYFDNRVENASLFNSKNQLALFVSEDSMVNYRDFILMPNKKSIRQGYDNQDHIRLFFDYKPVVIKGKPFSSQKDGKSIWSLGVGFQSIENSTEYYVFNGSHTIIRPDSIHQSQSNGFIRPFIKE